MKRSTVVGLFLGFLALGAAFDGCDELTSSGTSTGRGPVSPSGQTAGTGNSSNTGPTAIPPASGPTTTSAEGRGRSLQLLPTGAAWPPQPDQPVTLAPHALAANTLIILDNSGSMTEKSCGGQASKFTTAQQALTRFLNTLKPTDQVALAVFSNKGGRLLVPFGQGAAHLSEVNQQLGQAVADGGTPLSGALLFGYQQLTAQAQRQSGYGTYRLVVITDGESQDGNPALVARAITAETPIEQHVIGFCVGAGHSLNIPGVTAYYTANDPASLDQGLQATQAEAPDFALTRFQEH